MANTVKKPWVLAISHNYKPYLDEILEPLIAELRPKADFLKAENAEQTERLLSRHPISAAILITDKGLAGDQNSHVWHAVLPYVRGGGTPFFAQAGSGWCCASHTGETFALNDEAVGRG
ncbi:transcription factor Rba50 [Fusarium pseudoanthophilum]|uniref:Transcription factor Rba50 n=1 Tax=Fusarium pseudoanthophilum TaxID=48495 RepID=A0A8H5LC84_9HYPO|nr:transcription factor Rba50 [Fusarium pseudoanthophilum]